MNNCKTFLNKRTDSIGAIFPVKDFTCLGKVNDVLVTKHEIRLFPSTSCHIASESENVSIFNISVS